MVMPLEPQEKQFNVCLIGSGGVGTVAALVLENSGMANVTAVLRSKYAAVSEKGWDVDSVDHGKISGWRPSRGKFKAYATFNNGTILLTHIFSVVATVSDAAICSKPYDYVVVSTKQLPSVSPLAPLIAPVITPGLTTIVLIQNGIDIELPLIDAFPTNGVMSSVSMIGSHVESPNRLVHSAPDISTMGTHFHSGLSRDVQWKRTVDFVEMYRAGGAKEISLTDNMASARWSKLVWNATFNTLCALNRMNVGELQRSGGRDTLLIPMMFEVLKIAKSVGHIIDEEIVMRLAYRSPDDCPYRPSMLIDIESGRPMEIEVILGNALKRAKDMDVHVPIMESVHELLKLQEWKISQSVLIA